MYVYSLLAALCIIPLASSMFLNHPGLSTFDYPSFDAPDRKIFRRNAFGQIQSFDVSHESQLVPNAFGGVSRYNVMEISDPDIFTNTVPGMGGMGPSMFPTPGFGMPGLNPLAGGLTGGLDAGLTGTAGSVAGAVPGTLSMPLAHPLGALVGNFPLLG